MFQLPEYRVLFTYVLIFGMNYQYLLSLTIKFDLKSLLLVVLPMGVNYDLLGSPRPQGSLSPPPITCPKQTVITRNHIIIRANGEPKAEYVHR